MYMDSMNKLKDFSWYGIEWGYDGDIVDRFL